MDEIDGFWVGAVGPGRAFDVRLLAERVGGLEPLARGGAEALIAAGVDPAKAQEWASCVPQATRGRAITLLDAAYPARLREIAHAPPLLCVQGDLAAWEGRAVAVVGTRRCTSYGSSVARHLGHALAVSGACVVSGLARGIDAAAHRAAVEVGRTIAVLGHGLAHMAPPSNRALRQRIAAEGGLVVSGWLDDDGPQPWTFPERNAWIAGLSEAVVVVEAPTRSGALITARYAAEQGREVYAVPGPIGAPASRGCLDLLAEGAGVVADVETFVALRTGRGAPRKEDWLLRLFAGQTVDDVARFARRTTHEILTDLAHRELRGEVVRLPGQRYAPRGRPP